MPLNYLDVCSGISAPTMAWKPLGWRALCFAETAKAPRAVLKHHYPEVPLHGDFTKLRGDEHGPVDLLVGGTPCQGFSNAGRRGGLDDERSGLSLEFARLAYRSRARWMVWENTLGAFSTNEGRDFGAILAEFSGHDGLVFERPADGWRSAGIVEPANERSFGLAWRVLDALHFGVPQRRRRIILVGYLGDWRPSAAVLFERESLSGRPPPRRRAGKAIAAIPDRSSSGSGGILIDVPTTANCLTARMDKGINTTGDEGQTLVPIAFSAKDKLEEVCEDFSPPLRAGAHDGSHANGGVMPAIASDLAQITHPDNRSVEQIEQTPTLAATGQMHVAIPDYHDALRSGSDSPAAHGKVNGTDRMTPIPVVDGNYVGIRKITPKEAERLQGFPDDFTLIPWRKGMMPDGPRYKMIGNSQAVPKIRWIGERIEKVEGMLRALGR